MPAPTIATARIDDLMLRAIIGCNDWERAEKQDIVINVSMEFDARKAIKSDGIEDTLDYKAVKRRIIQEVEASSFQLLESLVHHVLSVVMGNERVRAASVRIDKPHALRFARSVSIEMHRRR